MVGLTTYAILKHQFLDIKIIIQRGIIYGFLFGMIAIVYIILLQFLGYLLHKTTDITSVISAGITMMIGIFFIKPLGDYFRRVTDPIFFKDQYNYGEALHQLSKILHIYINQADIIENSSELLKSIFKTDRVKFHLAGKDSLLSSGKDKSISINIIFQQETIGMLELGAKKSGDDYTPRDRKLLETFAYQAAVALEKARLYDKVQDYNIHLEQLVDKRTVEIKKIQEDQKRAMIDISHNLQTPLTVISGELEFLTDSNVSQDKVENIRKSLTRISQFINQLLRLAKLDQDVFNIDLSKIDFSQLVREQAEYFETMAKEKDIEINLSIKDSVFILGNKKLLSELVTNLVSNAMKYRKHGLEKSVIFISVSKDGKFVDLTVTDNGIGISSDDIPRVFDRFYRGAGKSEASGTGLGLAICQKIAQKHNGSIMVESILGDKSIFTVRFPSL